jgi:predicted amino acid racemase
VHSRVLTVDLAKVEHNARAVVDLCAAHGIAVSGVTKGVCGEPDVARAMLRGGVVSLGESRLENVRRLRAGGVRADVLLLRIPSMSHVAEVVELAGTSCNAEVAVVDGLAAAARVAGVEHGVMVMVDVGDLREGVWPDQLVTFTRHVRDRAGLRLAGVGANLACFGGVIPSPANMGRLVELVGKVEEELGERVAMVSGGNSSALPLVTAGEMPCRVNHLRIGEAILLGRETVGRRAWPGTVQDAVVLHGEVLELGLKPSVPIGTRGQNAMGQVPEFTDRGWVHHALVNLGTVDTDAGGLSPLDPRLRVLGGSSDYLVVDVSEARGELRVGDRVSFVPGYGAMVRAASSPYVELRCT